MSGIIKELKSITKSYQQAQICCRVLVVNKIQPNERNEETPQEGWTLHHSELESYLFAKRHGWEIIKIIIDRDCCRVCGATLGVIEGGAIHAKIYFYGQFLKGETGEQPPTITQTTQTEEKVPVIEMTQPQLTNTTPITDFDQTMFNMPIPPVNQNIPPWQSSEVDFTNFDFGVPQTGEKSSGTGNQVEAMEEDEKKTEDY
jgi:hypothetical protein